MEDGSTVTAFAGERLLASGSKVSVALAMKDALGRDGAQQMLAFDDKSGRQIDLDLSGTDEDIAARLAPPTDPVGEEKRSSGRPKLGVVAREITLLPRHWEWLADQPGGASVTIRKLVNAARSADDGSVRQAQQAADRFMLAVLGNQPGYEEAARALYAGDRDQFFTLTEHWPAELRDHTRRLAAPALRASAEP